MILTEAEKFQEKYKCAKNPIYFLNTYGYVYDASESKVMPMKCFPYQIRCVQEFDKHRNNIVLKSRQCVPKDTLIDTPGGPKAIQNFKVGDLIYSYNLKTNKIEMDTISDSWMSGQRNCIKIKLKNSKAIEVGENHPLWIVNQQDWVRAQDLQVGDIALNVNDLKNKNIDINNVEFDEVLIQKIETTNSKNCYDISVSKNENFFINGVLVHNTGLSVVTAGYVAWRLMFRYEEKILIIANKGDGAIRFLDTVKQFIERTPKWLRPAEIAKNNQTELEFEKPHASWVKAKASSPEAGRGESLTMLVLDETAFIKDDEQIWMGAGMALSATGGKCIMISTPNGTGSLYHKTWVNSIKNDNDFNHMRVHWTENPQSSKGLIYKKDLSTGEDIPWSPWYEEQCRRLSYDPVKIAQELDLSFEGSKYLAIESNLIEKYVKKIKNYKPTMFLKYDWLMKGTTQAGSFTTEESNFHVFKKPEKDKSYLIGGDVARGNGRDYSTLQVIDVDTLEQVAEYRDKIGVDIFPYLIDWVGRKYNNAFVAVEANTFGLGVCYDLRDKFKYKRLFYSKNVQEIHVRPTDFRVPEGVEIPGFQSTKATRPMWVKTIQEHMREGTVTINSLRLLAEMSTFIMNNGRPEAESGFNDDLIAAFGIALYVRDTEYSNISLTSTMTKAMLDAFSFSSGNSLDSVTDVPEYLSPDKKPGENKNIDLTQGGNSIFWGDEGFKSDDDDLSWLMK